MTNEKATSEKIVNMEEMLNTADRFEVGASTVANVLREKPEEEKRAVANFLIGLGNRRIEENQNEVVYTAATTGPEKGIDRYPVESKHLVSELVKYLGVTAETTENPNNTRLINPKNTDFFLEVRNLQSTNRVQTIAFKRKMPIQEEIADVWHNPEEKMEIIYDPNANWGKEDTLSPQAISANMW